ncbi:unnamed protein product [Cuscuta europaea]|uniref:Endopeptidase Clp n=1 Tax=Cuscuta europaea TaxID=41803 RepID=A0A9P1A0A1_CUSEU|nr:unnamed protein product [Cuscuta europaea]
MQFVRPDTQTICLGLAASMGSFLLVGGNNYKTSSIPSRLAPMRFFDKK